MKKALIIIFALLLASCASASASSRDFPLVIGHNCTDISRIPANWITAARQKFRIAYGHTSHGSQLVSGMRVLREQNSLYDFNSTGSNGALKLHDYAFSSSRHDLGHNGDTTWVDLTRKYLNNPEHSDINVIMWSWCGGVSDNTEQGINTYLNSMDALEKEFPDVTFIYMTGHLDGTGINGNLHRNNEQIRRYCRNHNKVLFDFADIESYDPDGNYYLDRYADDGCFYDSNGDQEQDSNWADAWCQAHPGKCSDTSCAHSRPLNCDMKGQAVWWMLARLAGWLPAPSVTADIDGQQVTLAWSTVDGADGFYLFYAPYPFMGVDTIGNIDMGDATTISGSVPHGFAYYLAVRAYNPQGMSDYSNIELVQAR